MNPARTIALTAALLALAPAARAHVIEIMPNGEVLVISPDADQTPSPSTGARSSAARLASLQGHLADAGASVELSPALLEAVAWAESRFQTQAVSPKGAIGVMQLMPATATTLGVDPREPGQNIRGGAAYLRSLLEDFNGNLELALAAYNAGPDAVRRYHGVPPFPETRAFVAAVLSYMAEEAVSEPNP